MASFKEVPRIGGGPIGIRGSRGVQEDSVASVSNRPSRGIPDIYMAINPIFGRPGAG